MKPFYRPLFLQAWNVARKNFFLLVLAFMASFVIVSYDTRLTVDLFQPSADSVATTFTQTDFITGSFIFWNSAFDSASTRSVSAMNFIGQFAILVIFVLLFGITMIIISAEGGLIYGTKRVLEGKKTNFLLSFREGFDKFWILFFTYIVYTLFFLLIANLIIIPSTSIALSMSPGSRIVIISLAYFVLIPILVILTLVKRYSQMFIMLAEPGSKKHSTFAASLVNSIRDGWLLFQTNWIISIETAIVLTITMLAAAMLCLGILIGLFILFILFGVLLSGFATIFQIVVVLSFVVVMAVLAFCVAFFTAFQTAVWVGVFEKLTTGVHQSKVHRALHHLPWLHRKFI